jgi:uncharacterized protein (UPF0276 family)
VVKLGVGLMYQAVFQQFIEEAGDAFDFLEIIPDTLWADLGPGHRPRYIDDNEAIDFLSGIRERIPVVPHSIGLSTGSAHYFNRDHVVQLARWHERFQFPWHSEHFSFNVAESAVGDVNVGLTMPLPLDEETLTLMASRVTEIQASLPIPFLLENNVYYFRQIEQEMTEPEFFNALCRETGCGLLMDLHNVYTNARNHGFDPLDLLRCVEMDRIVELHVAGGMERDGFYLDSHSGAIAEPIWELVEWILPQCSNLRGVTFELMGSWYPTVGEARLRQDLSRLRTMWLQHQPQNRPILA